MAKRGAASELNHNNWDDEEEPEEAGTFIQASTDVMQSRIIKKAKRRGAATEDSGAKKPVFGGFAGFSSKPGPAMSDTTPTGLTFGGSFGSTKTTSFGAASSLNGSEEKKANAHGDSSDSSSYFHALKSLNEGVLSWIKQHVEKNPYIFLTPIFKDYETHLAAIETKRSASSPSAGSALKKDSLKDNDNSTSSAKPLFSAAQSDTTTTGSEKQDDKGKPTSKPFAFGVAPSTQPEKPKFGEPPFANGGSFKFSTSSSSTAGFSFSVPKTGDSTAAPSLGKPSFSFGSTGGSFGSLSSSQGSSSLFAGASSASQSSSQGSEGKDDEEYEPPKPEVREIKEDDALYSKRCKLYYQRDGQWVDRGVGNIHLKPVADVKTQMLVRADTNLGNILLNVMLSSTMPVSRQGKNNVFLACVPNPPLSSKPEDEKSEVPVSMLIRVKTAEDADELKAKIDERVKLLSS